MDFKDLDKYLKKKKCDGFLFDIGMSTMQLTSNRGFSFKEDAPLDMRMNQKQKLTAKEVVNKFSQKKLEDIIFHFGEEKKAKKVAEAIVSYRRKKQILTTTHLLDAIGHVLPRTRKRIHPATLVFQALRIYVNDELAGLEKAIKDAILHLNEKGRIGVISFHSLEDRIVKNVFRNAKNDGFKILTKKPITPTKEEVLKNPKARSAKLRFGELCKEDY